MPVVAYDSAAGIKFIRAMVHQYVLSLIRRLTPVAVAVLLGTGLHAQDGCGVQAPGMDLDYGPVCLVNGQALLMGTPVPNGTVPHDFQTVFLLSRGNSLLIDQIGPSPTFSVSSPDVWRIHPLVFDPATYDPGNIAFGVETVYGLRDQLAAPGAPCAGVALSVPGAKTVECDQPCLAVAPGLGMDSTLICLGKGQAVLTATTTTPGVVPAGFELRYLLSRSNGLIIDQVSATPDFTVSSAEIWRIHTFVYDPATFNLSSIVPGVSSVYDIYPQTLAAGGTLCAQVLMHAPFVKTGECKPACTASAGGLTIGQPDLCLTGGNATAHAIPDGNATVPAGFHTMYLLTAAASPNIVLATAGSPAFTVTHTGQYRINTFIFDPGTFDPATIVPGTTTLVALNAQLIAGGGPLCGALDLVGALFQVAQCGAPCEADAGAMLPEATPVCLGDSGATIAAVSFGDTLVPTGYQLAYLLSGNGADLLAHGTTPVFQVDTAGNFGIHALVYDPATLDLAALPWGSIGILDLNAMLVQGGGTICAGLDVLGAQVAVEDCGLACGAGENAEITVCLNAPIFQLFDSLGGNPCPGGTWSTPTAQVMNGEFNPATNAAGLYFYTITSPTGQTSTAILTVHVIDCAGPEYQADLMPGTDRQESPLQVWPNPAERYLRVALPFVPNGAVHVELYDGKGRKAPVKLVETGEELLLDLGTPAPGIWTLRVASENRVYGTRFMR